MTTHPTLFITHRGERHQQAALDAAPAELDVTLRRTPSKDELIALLPGKEFLITERSGEISADIIRAGHDLRRCQDHLCQDVRGPGGSARPDPPRHRGGPRRSGPRGLGPVPV